MQLNLGQKIRELRASQKRTQEELATALGVTPQAVSRWEASGSYPDMELIPSIANYFHVSIDELFGYNNEREIRLSAYIEEIEKMRECYDGKFKAAVEDQETFIRHALAEFPNEWKLQMRLAWVLESKAADEKKSGKDGDQILKEAIALLEQARNNCDDIGWKDSITDQLAQQYTAIDDNEKREKLAADSSPIYISREMIRAYSKDEKMHKQYTAEAVLELIHSIAWVINWNWADSPDVFIAMADLYKALFGGKDYGMFNSDMCEFFLRAAYQYAKLDNEKLTTECFDLAFQHFDACNSSWEKKENKITSPLLSCAAKLPRRYVLNNTDFIASAIAGFPENIASSIRSNPKYARIFDKQE